MRSYSISPSALFVLLALVATPATAEVLYQTGFDPPTFAPGTLVGQDGWSALDGLSPDAATVQSQVSHSPPNSVRIQGSRLDRLEIPGSPDLVFLGSYSRSVTYDPVASNTPILALSANVRVDGTPSAPFGAGITVLDPSNVGIAYIALDFDGGQGLVELGNEDGGSILGPSYSVGEWANLTVVFDFQQGTANGFFNGTLFGQIDFSSGAIRQIGAVDLFAGALDQQPDSDAYVDDLSLRVVPEPSAMALLAAGMFGLAGHAWGPRRRRN